MKGVKIALSVFTWAASIAGVVVCMLLMVRWNSDWENWSTLEVMRDLPEIMMPLVTGMNITYALMGVAVIAVLGFAIAGMIIKPKAGIKSLVGIAVVTVILLVSIYGLGGNTDPWWEVKYNLTSSTMQWISGGLIMSYIMGALAILALLFLEVNKLFK